MRRSRQIAVIAAALSATVLMGAAPASAHPLGNFSINHLDALTFGTDRIVDNAIVDVAEIPTAQAESTIDANGDGTESEAELAQYGSDQCEAYRQTLSLTVDDVPHDFATTSTAFAYREGQAGLRTTRLECQFEAEADLSAPRVVRFTNAFVPNRVGWHEIIASGTGTHLLDSPVPATSVTDGLTNYPVDLLSSPLDVRTAVVNVAPGAADASATGARSDAKRADRSAFSSAFGPMSRAVDRVNAEFNDLVGRRDLTVGVGLLAIGLALVLGASHALLPGHGKTVMAAYIAGRQGSVRDAVLVGATVTATHTGGVLLLGLALTLSSSLAGESVLNYLGVISGLMIAVLGASLLCSASRRLRGKATGDGHSHGHGHGHSHAFGHHHGPGGHTHSPPQNARVGDVGPGLVGASRMALATGVTVDPLGRSLLAEDRNLVADAHQADAEALELLRRADSQVSVPKTELEAMHAKANGPVSRLGLIGMGIAGGLVPSPSALVVLLSAIALGRTVFGVVLVVGYGAGMAGTLTLAGVLLVRVRDRYQDRAPKPGGRVRTVAARWTRVAPFMTASLVLIVGLGLALRSLGSI